MYPIPYVLPPARRPYLGPGRPRPDLIPDLWTPRSGPLRAFVPSAPVQTVSSSVNSTSLPLTVAAPKTGNTMVLCIGSNTGNMSSVAQTGVTWTGFQVGGSNGATEIWLGTAITSSPGTTITITPPATGRVCGLVMEWPGLLLPTSGDQKSSATSAGSTTVSSGTITPGQPNELVVAIGVTFTTITGGPTGGFTAATGSPVTSATFSLAVAYLIQGAAASANSTWTIASTAWDGAIVSLKAQPNPQMELMAPFLAQ